MPARCVPHRPHRPPAWSRPSRAPRTDMLMRMTSHTKQPAEASPAGRQDGVAAPAKAQTDAASALDIQGLTVSYHDKPVLRDVTASIAPRQLVAVIGPNGAGKSTLLKAILGLIH